MLLFAGVVHHNQVLGPVAVEIRRAQEADQVVDGEDFRSLKTELGLVVGRAPRPAGNRDQGAERDGDDGPHGLLQGVLVCSHGVNCDSTTANGEPVSQGFCGADDAAGVPLSNRSISGLVS